ncbi:hypothetical protein [Tautonia plasticadhaerens]|uniref:Uncharacterized protein n=1 Tax=Tautonia plasticadhaerens TaxID=2527974 RepID=A0A518HE87_9BACT|nr:hypothetical protein [Tautonia plasticadhaerens]QDV39164.1 hypothetical protein ElP_71280 [Tautonia plasticadhaerens]
MTDRAGPGEDPRLAELTEAITRRLLAGEPIDSPDDPAQPPDCAESIRELLPTILELVGLGRGVARAGQPSPPPLPG